MFTRFWSNTEPSWDRRDVPWIVRIAIRWAVVALGFLAAREAVNWLWETDRMFIGGWEDLILASGIFLLLRSVVRPLLVFITCPLQLMTLGLFILVINAIIVLLTDVFADWLGIGFEIDGFLPAFVAALVISAVSFVLDRLVHRNMFGTRWV
jgi:putative membrane protein